MEADIFKKSERKAEVFSERKGVDIPIYRRYSYVLNTMALHASPGNVCVVNYHKLLHVFSQLETLFGTSQVMFNSNATMKIAEMANLDVEVLNKFESSANFVIPQKLISRYDEFLDWVVRLIEKFTDVNKRNNTVKQRFIVKIGKNNCAILFNSLPAEGKQLPRKFELFKDVINIVVACPELPGGEYGKLVSMGTWCIPNFHTLKLAAPFLVDNHIGAANADHSYCLLLCEGYEEYYMAVPTSPFCALLNSVVASPANETVLRKALVQRSLNTIINNVFKTDYSNASGAFKLARDSREFRRVY